MPDPFTQVYDALWALYETRLTGEKIKYSYEDPHYLPRIMRFNEEHDVTAILVVENGSFKLTNSSSGSGCILRFTWMFKANDVRVNKVFLPQLFELYRALAGWNAVVGALTWQGKPYCKILNEVQLQAGVEEKHVSEDSPTLLLGWKAVLTHAIEMFFTTSDLKAE